ncbi:MAG: C39 family peptidase, partial [Syntrophothermus sp.]
MSKRNITFLAGAGFLVLALALSQIPAINSRLAWRYEVAKTYARNVLHPVGSVPTAIPITPGATETASPTPTVTLTPENLETVVPATPTLAPPPAQASLASPPYEKQTPNNCGPAALSMLLKYYGWTGDQKTISDVIKPVTGDRNVNPEELAFWVRNYAGW